MAKRVSINREKKNDVGITRIWYIEIINIIKTKIQRQDKREKGEINGLIT